MEGQIAAIEYDGDRAILWLSERFYVVTLGPCSYQVGDSIHYYPVANASFGFLEGMINE